MIFLLESEAAYSFQTCRLMCVNKCNNNSEGETNPMLLSVW